MAFHVRDPQTDRLVRDLAEKLGVGLTEAVRLAVSNELQRAEQKEPLYVRLRRIAEPLRAYPETGLATDKAFFDDLSGN